MAPTNNLQRTFWVYKKMPRVFSANTISNAIVLASFQSKGFPRPSTNRIVIWADHIPEEPEPPYFEITPDSGEFSYNLGDRSPELATEYFKDAAIVERAWDALGKLGVHRGEFVKTNIASYGEAGVYLPRQIDGIQVNDESEGFSFQQFGRPIRMRSFWLSQPNLERTQKRPTASAREIVACIRAFKTASPPDGDEPDYFKRIKSFSRSKRLIITKITPYYNEGIYGEVPTNGELPKIVLPIAQLNAVADFGESNVPVRLLSPIISSEVIRLLGNKNK